VTPSQVGYVWAHINDPHRIYLLIRQRSDDSYHYNDWRRRRSNYDAVRLSDGAITSFSPTVVAPNLGDRDIDAEFVRLL
jgi:hypothetical protein